MNTRVENIYPSAARWPANTLRFYIEFSAAMAEDQALTRLHLIDAGGVPQQGVFLDTARELWSADRRRLTVLFDPGRVKRGLRAHAALGRALRSGQDYRLVIDAEWCDADGRPLATATTHEIRVVDPVTCVIVPQEWRWVVPPAGSLAPLHVAFPYPLDRMLLARCLTLLDASDRPVTGTATIDDGEIGWRFAPRVAWSAQPYRLRVSTILEDPAGNNLYEPFDHPIGELRRHAVFVDLAVISSDVPQAKNLSAF